MTSGEKTLKRSASGLLIAQAAKHETTAQQSDAPSEQQRLRGLALILRGSAWLLDAEVLAADNQ